MFIAGSSLRRKRDSNPRRCDPQQFSRLPHSTTLPFLLECLISYLLNAGANITSFFNFQQLISKLFFAFFQLLLYQLISR